MENNKSKSFEFTNGQISEIECVLVKAIETFHESNITYSIKHNVQDYFIEYCYQRGYPLEYTLEVANKILKPSARIKMDDIVPKSKRGQENLISGTLSAMLVKSGAIWSEEKTDEMMTEFCKLTSVSKDMATPIITTLVKRKKREVIERDLYDFLSEKVAVLDDETDRKLIEKEVIGSFAEKLHLDPKYIYRVLRNKKKVDEERKQRMEAFKASKTKPTKDTLPSDNSDGR